jgi:cyclopropane fatty-acyl-phospholipid synthase-like methyltransferase
MSAAKESECRDYEAFYENFDSPLMRQLRREAYGEDIGQHSWVTADELRENALQLGLSPESHLLDLGCGPCGPLTFLIGFIGCRATGADLSAHAIAAGYARAVSLGLEKLLSLRRLNLNDCLPFASSSFNAVVSLDVMLHLRDRLRTFREAARVLVSGGRFLFTDAGVITGSISNEKGSLRSIYGYTQFVPSG